MEGPRVREGPFLRQTRSDPGSVSVYLQIYLIPRSLLSEVILKFLLLDNDGTKSRGFIVEMSGTVWGPLLKKVTSVVPVPLSSEVSRRSEIPQDDLRVFSVDDTRWQTTGIERSVYHSLDSWFHLPIHSSTEDDTDRVTKRNTNGTIKFIRVKRGKDLNVTV